jgi:hypothetical protein
MLAAMWLTAIGTLAVAIAAVWVALWSERRTDKRVAAEREESARQLAGERAHSAEQLAAEHAHAAEMLAQEQAFSRDQLAEERRLALEQEQLAEAYAVQVVGAESLFRSGQEVHSEPEEIIPGLVAIVVNHGTYVITRVEAQFHLPGNGGGSLIPVNLTEWRSGYTDLHEQLRAGLGGPPQRPMSIDRLAPWDRGIRFFTDAIATKFTLGWYPVVRWTDRWGIRWEHARGAVRQVDESAPWNP